MKHLFAAILLFPIIALGQAKYQTITFSGKADKTSEMTMTLRLNSDGSVIGKYYWKSKPEAEYEVSGHKASDINAIDLFEYDGESRIVGIFSLISGDDFKTIGGKITWVKYDKKSFTQTLFMTRLKEYSQVFKYVKTEVTGERHDITDVDNTLMMDAPVNGEIAFQLRLDTSRDAPMVITGTAIQTANGQAKYIGTDGCKLTFIIGSQNVTVKQEDNCYMIARGEYKLQK